MASGERIRYELRAGAYGEDELVVVRVEGSEGLSAPYRFEVDFVARAGDVELADVVGAEAVLSIRRPTGEERVVHGEAIRAALTGVAAGVPRYRVTIAPRLARLQRTARSRVFQAMTVPQIVQSVLSDHGVTHRASLSAAYPTKEFVVQYRESDLAFLSRLLEGEGIWYRFEHSDDAHELVLGDTPSALAEREGTLDVRPESGQADGAEHLTRLACARRMTPTKAVRCEFDFCQPAGPLTATEGDGALEVYDYPGGDVATAELRRRTKTLLGELRHGEETWEGEGNAVGALPGTKLDVDGAGTLAVVRVTHRGEQEQAPGAVRQVMSTYANRFEAIPGDRPYRPRRTTPLPRAAGIETATVVGPAGEEIHPDRYGRVKVRFHWDREGPGDDRASCWVRVAQAWAGPVMGATFLPRVGQEVVVRFLEGDPDRPLVTGAVYNGANAAPVALPAEKTRSTLRTDSSPGGGGSNELRFEDASGQEEVLLHAQKNLDAAVENDAGAAVQVNQALEVTGDRTQQVLGAQSLRVDVLDVTRIDGAATLTVAGERTTTVGLAHVEEIGKANAVTVAKNRYVSVGLASAETVGAALALSVGGGYVVNVGGALNYAVAGLKATQVGGAAIELVGAARDETIGKDRNARTQGDVHLEVDGGASLETGKDATEKADGDVEIGVPEGNALLCQAGQLEADTLRIVVNGKVALELERSGAATLSGAAVTIEGG